MYGKRRVLVVAAAAAGMVGMSAPLASAQVVGGNAGVVNIAQNQTSGQVCNNQVPVNVLGVQVPVNGLTGALGAASGPTVAGADNSCHQPSAQINNNADPGMLGFGTAATHGTAKSTAARSNDGYQPRHANNGGNAGVVNIAQNQTSGQVCGNHVPVNVLGVQVPVDDIAGALGILSAGSTVSAQNNSCHQASGQANNN